MRKVIRNSSTYIILFFTACCFITCSSDTNESDNQTYESLKDAFLNPSGLSKPKVYWWCLNGNIDTVRAKQEMLAMKEAGIGGFDLFEIGVPKQDNMIPGGPAFLSDESLNIIKYVITEAGRLGLTVGLNLASSWNAGGSWVKPEHGGKSLYFSKIRIKGNAESQSVKIPFPKVSFLKESLIGGTDKPMVPFQANGKPEYHEEVAILAIPAHIDKNALDTSRVINVSRFFNPEEDILEWKAPAGEWDIHRYICSNSGQQLVLPSPLSAGLTIDHFDSVAVKAHLMYVIERLQSVLGDFRNTALKSFYLASYEARGFVWTSTLTSEFKKVNEYDISSLIPSLFDQELFSTEITKKVESDFKKTLSELMINNLYKTSQKICSEYGLQINCEAGGPGFPLYNGPAEPLKALGSLDIPRGEFWINHARFYQDNNGKDSIDILRVVKEVAAASHIYKKGIVEEEAFTSFQHWQEGPFDMKPLSDRAFCEGMNRVVFHGFSHNPRGSGFPGYVYHAGTHFNDKRAWWPKAKPFIQYISRLSSVFQKTDFFADVIWYYGDKVPNSATPKNNHFSVGPGYDYEVVNTEILVDDLSVENGKLVLSNGATFSVLALENEENINPHVLVKLAQLVDQGAAIVGAKPKNISNVRNSPLTQDQGLSLIDQLWNSPDDTGSMAKIISTERPLDALNSMNIEADFSYAGNDQNLLDFIHYKKKDIDFYLITNYSNNWLSKTCGFRQQGKIPEIWDPVSGDLIPISIYKQVENYLNFPITLAPHGSQLVVLRKNNTGAHYTSITSTVTPPQLEYTKDGFIILQDAEFQLTKGDKSIAIDNEVITQTVEGSWELLFPKGWGAPDKVNLPKLTSWTNSDIESVRYFSGTATYKKTFEYSTMSGTSEEHKIYLELGKISKVAEVWLNDEYLGITWTKPYKFDVTSSIRLGKNNLTIEVANTWSNRLTGDAITGQKFTNSNIVSTVKPTDGMMASSQERVPWADVPLIESGLLGPITISSYKKWKISTQ